MTKHEALVTIAQTVLRSRKPKGWCGPTDLSEIVNVVGDCASLVEADISQENAAILELCRRYNLVVELVN